MPSKKRPTAGDNLLRNLDPSYRIPLDGFELTKDMKQADEYLHDRIDKLTSIVATMQTYQKRLHNGVIWLTLLVLFIVTQFLRYITTK